MIKVLQLTENPIAGAPINLSKALNKWQGDKIQSRHLAQSANNGKRIFDSDLIIDQLSYDDLYRIIADSDVIHFHNFYQNQHLFRKHPKLWPVVMTKKRVWQAHTQRDISWMSMEDGLKDKGAKHLVIAQYHPRLYPECTVVPNVIDIFDPLYMPQETNNEIPKVAYSPSRVRLSGWDNKGYDETVPVLQKLVNSGIIRAEIIYDRPHAECMSRRGRADIGIDEIVTGSYHLCSLESLSQGLATVAGLDEIQIRTLRNLTGADSLPWVIAGPEGLEAKLTILCTDRESLCSVKTSSRKWMERYWHPEITTEHFVRIYESL